VGLEKQCVTAIKELFTANGVTEFTNKAVQVQVTAKGFSERCYYRAKQLLLEEGVIKPGSKRGHWYVERSLLSVDEEPVTANGSKPLAVMAGKLLDNGFTGAGSNNSKLLPPDKSYSSGSLAVTSIVIKKATDIMTYLQQSGKPLPFTNILARIDSSIGDVDYRHKWLRVRLVAMQAKGDVYSPKLDYWSVLE